ncbi:MAG TPA: CBS domain-containing protein [Chloroflexota bacterium]|jgi:CBS domain-containing protein|nr:CBS domain-containing protein [Chloroflexota bacterium]
MNSLVQDMMTSDVVTVEPSTPFKEIVARLAGRRVSAVPVLDADGRVLGVVSEADLLLKEEHPDAEQSVPLVWTRRRRIEREKAAGTCARELMTAPPVTVPPTATVAEAARRMHTAGVKRLPVVGEDGRLLGIVSRADLLKVFARPDEAIRREIVDEVILRDFMMDPSRFFVRVEDGVVVLEGAVERRSLVPFVLRAVQGVESVVRVENRLTYDVDDRGRDVLMTPWLRP